MAVPAPEWARGSSVAETSDWLDWSQVVRSCWTRQMPAWTSDKSCPFPQCPDIWGKGSYSSMRHHPTCQDSVLLLSACCLLLFHWWNPALSVVGQELGCLLQWPSGTCLPVLRTVHTVRGIILVLRVERVAECCLASQLEDSALKGIEPWLRS